MMKRRSLREAMSMTPAQRAFIEQGPAPPAASQRTAATKPDSAAPTHIQHPAPTRALSEGERTPARSRSRKGTAKPPHKIDGRLSRASSTLTTRLQFETAEALRRASLERKLENEQPATTQAILEAALQDWLRRNGYLA